MRIPFLSPGNAAVGALRAANPHFAARDRARQRRLSIFLLLPLAFAAFLIGAAAGLDAPGLLTIVAAAVFAMVAALMMSASGLLQVMFVVTFLLQGSALYFGGLRAAPWMATGIAGLFIFRVLMDLVLKTKEAKGERAREAAAGVLIGLGLYLACYFASIAMNRPSAGQLLSAFKSNLPMLGVLGALAWFRWEQDRLEKLWKIAVWVMVLQLPVVIYQHFYIATLRRNGFDSVVGTFGGTPLQGGLSSMLVLFVVAVMGYAVARWNRGLSSTGRMLLICTIGMAVVMLGEVKAAFLWLPLVMFFVLRKRIMRNVLSFAMYGLLASAALGAVYYTYDALYWADSKTKLRTRAEQDRADNYFFDVRNVDYRTGEISRGASLAFWWVDRQANIPHRLLGYGPGASKSAGPLGGGGKVARRHAPLNIDATAAAVLLWDVGLLGAAAYLAMLLAGVRAGWRTLKAGMASQDQLAIVDVCTAVMLVYVTMLVYNRTQLDEPTVQLMFMFCLGCIVQVARYGKA
jgi:hypothetical protein